MKLIVFDIDGTLTNTKPIDDACFLQVFKSRYDLDLNELRWEDFKNVTDEGISRDIFRQKFQREAADSEIEEVKADLISVMSKWWNGRPTDFKEIPGASRLFYELEANPDYALGIATGSWAGSGKIKLDSIGLKRDDIPYGNSDHHITRQGIVTKVIEEAKLKHEVEEFEQIVSVGDGLWDKSTAEDLNLNFIGIDYAGNGKLTEVGARHVLKDYLDREAFYNAFKIDFI